MLELHRTDHDLTYHDAHDGDRCMDQCFGTCTAHSELEATQHDQHLNATGSASMPDAAHTCWGTQVDQGHRELAELQQHLSAALQERTTLQVALQDSHAGAAQLQAQLEESQAEARSLGEQLEQLSSSHAQVRMLDSRKKQCTSCFLFAADEASIVPVLLKRRNRNPVAFTCPDSDSTKCRSVSLGHFVSTLRLISDPGAGDRAAGQGRRRDG